MSEEYVLNMAPHATVDTSMLNCLLEDEHKVCLSTVTPSDAIQAFGPGDNSCYIPSKGYTDPEWYWDSSDGRVWGIAWRWGNTRIRGKGPRDLDAAYEFVEFLKSKLSASKQ